MVCKAQKIPRRCALCHVHVQDWSEECSGHTTRAVVRNARRGNGHCGALNVEGWRSQCRTGGEKSRHLDLEHEKPGKWPSTLVATKRGSPDLQHLIAAVPDAPAALHLLSRTGATHTTVPVVPRPRFGRAALSRGRRDRPNLSRPTTTGIQAIKPSGLSGGC